MSEAKEKMAKLIKKITKEEHISLHCEKDKSGEDVGFICENCRFAGKGCVETDIAERLIQNGATIAEWVSVDEPPKEDGRYLLLFEDGSMCDSIYEVKRGQFGIYEQYWNAVNGWFKVWQKADPTHWTPKPNIPQPPKEVQ